MGRGLLRLFLALWLTWLCYGTLTYYREIATYLGYDRWTFEKAAEREEVRRKVECEGKTTSLECSSLLLVPVNDFVSEERVNILVPMFVTAMIKIPFYLLLVLILIYWLGKWVIAGFRKKQNIKI